MNYDAKRRRRKDVAERAAYKDMMYSYCRIIGCGGTPTAAAGKGLDRVYCRRHADHFERHGSYTKSSYTAAQLASHRNAALAWLQARSEDRRIQLAVMGVEGLYRRAGPLVEVFRLRGLSPSDRAKAAWARLREAKVDPMRPLAAWLAVELTIAADPQADRKIEFKRVQAAKLVHRMASGSHKRWERARPDGRVVVEELHKFPHSRGQVLRHLGEQVERAAELLVTPCMADHGGTTNKVASPDTDTRVAKRNSLRGTAMSKGASHSARCGRS
jgi:hypothetical protein